MIYSSPGKRILAALIDGIVVSVLSVWMAIFGWYFGVFFGAFFAEGAYTILMMGSPWHATLGQRLLNMKVVDSYGNGIDYGRATLRYLSSLVSRATVGVGYFIGLFNGSYQTLHDIMVHSYVVDDGPVSAAAGNRAAGAIIGISGEKAGMRFALRGNGVMIGRDPAVCQLVMRKSNGISKLHCYVSYNPASRMYIISDRGSRYGTYTERGERITPDKSIALKSGERFYLGSRNNMFEVS